MCRHEGKYKEGGQMGSWIREFGQANNKVEMFVLSQMILEGRRMQRKREREEATRQNDLAKHITTLILLNIQDQFSSTSNHLGGYSIVHIHEREVCCP